MGNGVEREPLELILQRRFISVRDLFMSKYQLEKADSNELETLSPRAGKA